MQQFAGAGDGFARQFCREFDRQAGLAAGRQRDYRKTVMVTTLSPCWYCSGLVRQFGIGAVVIGEARTFTGGHDWLAEHGVEVTLLDDARCVAMMEAFIAARPELWHEDIGEAP